jgi:hypothetical protein
MGDTSMSTLSDFTRIATDNYLDAALFAESCNGAVPGCTFGENCDRSLSMEGMTIDNIDAESRETAASDVARFVESNWEIVQRYTASEVGYDLWMTRTGEGVGFWDGDYEAVPGDGATLTESVHKDFPHLDAYVSENGNVSLD